MERQGIEILEIREATIEDAEILANAEKAWAEEPGYLVSCPEELLSTRFRKLIEELSIAENGRYIVLEKDDGVVGHALLDPMGLKSLSHIVRLTIVVHKGYEGQGIGKRLMDDLIAWARNNPKVEKIELNVRSTNNRAISLYSSTGFTREGVLKNRIKTPGGGYMDDVLMGLFVK